MQGILIVNLEALASNYRLFQEKTGQNCAIAGIVKANAYGLGLKQVVNTLTELKCPQFFVATLDEALNFRKFNKASPIAVLGGLFTGAENTYTEYNITPVLNSLDDITRWKNKGQDENKLLPAFLHFDTGMNRLGLSLAEFEALKDDMSALDGINVQMIMSHFVSADDWAQTWAKTLTIEQAERFKEITVRFSNTKKSLIKKSLANSSGLFRDTDYHYDMVRPGYALYGGNPTPEGNNPMKPVVSLHTCILQVRECLKDQSIGYGASHNFKKDTRTATIALGYTDGFLRSHSNKAIVYYNNQPCPVIGRVSMDLVTIDISNIIGEPPKQGDMIEVIGPNQSIDDLAKSANTIGHEILTSLNSRYKREYIGR
jgi:alanine racemase